MSSDNNIRICVPLNEKSSALLAAASAKVGDVADLIELRLDGLESDELAGSRTSLNDLVNNIRHALIITFRSQAQGGYRAITEAERLSFWKNHRDLKATFFDIEKDLVAELTALDPGDQPDWSRVICSHHDFNGVPKNFEAIYDQMAFTPARIVKLAVKANEIVDCLEIFKLLERAQREQREIIAIAMGEAGVLTRILGPSRGSFLTYGASELERATAPGQLLASELKSIYRIDQINADTMITGLVGLPVMHSVSPHMHNAAFQAAQLNGVYLPFEVQNLRAFIKRMVDPRTREIDWRLRGLSITAPHKTEVLQYLDWIDANAREIGAVNTVVLENEQLLGYNTDADGLIEPLVRRIGSLAAARAAVIGAGGAAGAAIFALQQRGVDVVCYARDPNKAKAISQRFNISSEPLESASFAGNDIVINATPLGSFGRNLAETSATADQLRGSKLAYDLVYNPIETRFLREARTAGCEVLGGLEMLVAQAKLQFKLWTETNTSSELMYTSGFSALSNNSSRGS